MKPEPRLVREREVEGGTDSYSIDQVAKITLKLRKPVEESFDLNAPALKR